MVMPLAMGGSLGDVLDTGLNSLRSIPNREKAAKAIM